MRTNVSVIIPTHNRARLLPRALNSIIQQTTPPGEIIVVDDGSTDDTARLIGEKFPTVTYLRQHHLGVSSARNRGIRAARGEWLAFLDSDDEWLPEKLEKQLEALGRAGICLPYSGSPPAFDKPHSSIPATDPGLICHTNEIWIRRGKRVNQMNKHAKYGGFIFEKCLPLCTISPSAAVIHRSVFQDVGLFDESLPACEDYDLWLRICAFYPVLYLDIPLIRKYGGHPDQLSKKYWGMDRFRIRALEKIIHHQRVIKAYKLAAIEMILKKIAVYVTGAKKRVKTAEVRLLQQKREYYLELQKFLKSSDSPAIMPGKGLEQPHKVK